jgi:hypothetical protein
MLIPVETLPPKRKEELCVNLLTVGCLWDIAEAKTYAINTLSGMMLPSPRILQLARSYAIHDWVEGAVRELIPKAGDIDTDEAIMIGPTTLSILFRAKTQIERERMCIAHVAPKLTALEDLNYGDCLHHGDCQRVLKEKWFSLVGRKVLHPSKPLELDAIGAYLSNLYLPEITTSCYEDMVRKWTMNQFLAPSIIQGAVDSIKSFNMCCRFS